MRHRIVIAVMVAGCGTSQPQYFPSETHIVLSGEAALRLAAPCSRTSPGMVEVIWTPADGDVQRLEGKLPALLERELRARNLNDSLRTADYFRQYAGLVIEGRPIVYVSGFHRRIIEETSVLDRRNPAATWRDVAVDVCDGGPYLFGVEYDAETQQFANFSFSGSIASPHE